MEKTLPEINVLWTGGWDSTFRVLFLSRQEITLQPHYIYYENRRSRDYEIKAMEEVSKDILADPRTKCVFKPVKIVQFKDIPEDKEITEAFNRIRQQILIGPQYEYLARYAKGLGSLEIGVEQGGLAEAMMNKFGEMVQTTDENGLEYWELNKEKSTDDLNKTFGLFKYPLYKTTKLEMKEKATEMGFLDSMYKTWFCHFPHKGKPCGSCFPCKFTIQDGLPERFTKAALRRFKTDQKYGEKEWYKKYKKYRRRYFNY